MTSEQQKAQEGWEKIFGTTPVIPVVVPALEWSTLCRRVTELEAGAKSSSPSKLPPKPTSHTEPKWWGTGTNLRIRHESGLQIKWTSLSQDRQEYYLALADAIHESKSGIWGHTPRFLHLEVVTEARKNALTEAANVVNKEKNTHHSQGMVGYQSLQDVEDIILKLAEKSDDPG